jgi:hypothetical protein
MGLRKKHKPAGHKAGCKCVVCQLSYKGKPKRKRRR